MVPCKGGTSQPTFPCELLTAPHRLWWWRQAGSFQVEVTGWGKSIVTRQVQEHTEKECQWGKIRISRLQSQVQADFQCSSGQDLGQGYELRCSSWANRQKVCARGEQMGLVIVWYQSCHSMQTARPLGETVRRWQSPSVQSGHRWHGHPKADSFPGWVDPNHSASCVSCAPAYDQLGGFCWSHFSVSVSLLYQGAPNWMQVWCHKHLRGGNG